MAATFDVERFEHVAATPQTALLRVSGFWRAEEPGRLATPVLVVDDGREVRRLDPLPGPDDVAPLAGPEPPPWRAAFSAPTGLVVGADFALEAGEGVRVALGAPQMAHREPREARTAPRRAPAPTVPVPRVDESARAEAERRARERREALRELEARVEAERAARVEAERRAEAEARARERVEAALARGAARLAELEAELARGAGRLAELEAERDELQARLAAAQVPAPGPADEERERAEQALLAAQQRVDELSRELAGEVTRRSEAQAEAASLRGRLQEAHAQPDELEELRARVAYLEEAHEAAEDRADRIAVHREEALLRLRGLEARLGESGAGDARQEAVIAERLTAMRAEAARRADERRRGREDGVPAGPVGVRSARTAGREGQVRRGSDRLVAALLVVVGLAAAGLLAAGLAHLLA